MIITLERTSFPTCFSLMTSLMCVPHACVEGGFATKGRCRGKRNKAVIPLTTLLCPLLRWCMPSPRSGAAGGTHQCHHQTQPSWGTQVSSRSQRFLGQHRDPPLLQSYTPLSRLCTNTLPQRSRRPCWSQDLLL